MLVFYCVAPRGQSFVAISRADESQKPQDIILAGESVRRYMAALSFQL